MPSECAGALSGQNASVPRLAVCLVGFVRTLANPKVHASLSAFFRAQDSSADFFGVVATEAEDSAKGQYAPVLAASLEGALRVLRPIAWEEPRLGNPSCGLPCMQQFVRLRHCAELVAARERARARMAALRLAKKDKDVDTLPRPDSEDVDDC